MSEIHVESPYDCQSFGMMPASLCGAKGGIALLQSATQCGAATQVYVLVLHPSL
jgi:hypothetical protein